MTELSEIRARLAAATEGPWVRWRDQDGEPHMHGLLMVGIADEVIPDGASMVTTRDPFGSSPIAQCYIEEDAHLIANAPGWLAELCDRVERAEAVWAGFTSQLGYGDNKTERAATPHEMVQIWKEYEIENMELWESTERVRALHHAAEPNCPDDGHNPYRCPCAVVECVGCGEGYPCPTIEALDGDE